MLSYGVVSVVAVVVVVVGRGIRAVVDFVGWNTVFACAAPGAETYRLVSGRG